MDQASIDTYRKLGFTHFVERLQADGVTPEFHKVVKENPNGEGFIDENGREYKEAKALPGKKKKEDD